MSIYGLIKSLHLYVCIGVNVCQLQDPAKTVTHVIFWLYFSCCLELLDDFFTLL